MTAVQNEIPLFLSVTDISNLLKIHPVQIRAMLRKREIIGAKIANKWIVEREDFKAFIDSMKEEKILN